MSKDFFKHATKVTASGTVSDLSGDDLILTITAASVGSKDIYIGKVTGSCDVAALFSIVDNDSPAKVIERYKFANGGIVRLNEKDFDQENDFAPAGQNLIVKFEGDTTPTEVYLDIVAYHF